MLSNLETEKSKLLQIVLVGQPNLRDKLACAGTRAAAAANHGQLSPRPLDAEETAKYINHRLRRAAIGAPLEFPRDVTDIMHTRSRGVPRIINVICDATLVFGYAEERRQIDRGAHGRRTRRARGDGVLPPAQDGQRAARCYNRRRFPGDSEFPPAVPVAPAILPQSDPIVGGAAGCRRDVRGGACRGSKRRSRGRRSWISASRCCGSASASSPNSGGCSRRNTGCCDATAGADQGRRRRHRGCRPRHRRSRPPDQA